MANEENEIRAVTMDLNLYLGLPRSSYPRSLDLGSDLSLSSLPVPASSDSNENRSLEATSVTMDASSSHPPYSPSYAFMAEADVLPLANSWPMAAENPISPYFHAYEPQGYACAQESEAPSILYSPSNARDSQFDGLFAEPMERHGEEYRASFERVALDLVDTNLVQGAGFQIPYSPPYHPTSIAFQEEENFGTFPSFPSQMGSELFSRAGGSSSQNDLLHSPEFQIRRSIESHGWREMPFRQSLLPGTERTTIDRHSSLSPSQLMLEIMRSQRTIHANGNRNDLTEVLTAEISEKESGEKSKYATNFECNICFDVAKEPIVTSCGHLFCWPCLYQWLYVHSDHKECPVCKGEVPEANLTPIYGRGRSASTVDDKDEKNRVSDLPIPPRPCGNRLESWRQHFYPISRRIGEGIANSWRRFLNYQIHSRNRFTGHDDTLMQEIFNGETPASLTRYMTRRLQREHGITENGSSNAERIQRGDESIPIEGVQNDIDGVQGFHYLPSNDCLVAMNSDIGRTAGRYAQRNNLFGPSSSNAPSFGQYSSIPIFGAGMAADQASASSTVAVISGGSSARDVSVGPNSAGSSWRYRRTERNSTSVSSEEDGNLHSRKRRRLP